MCWDLSLNLESSHWLSFFFFIQDKPDEKSEEALAEEYEKQYEGYLELEKKLLRELGILEEEPEMWLSSFRVPFDFKSIALYFVKSTFLSQYKLSFADECVYAAHEFPRRSESSYASTQVDIYLKLKTKYLYLIHLMECAFLICIFPLRIR